MPLTEILLCVFEIGLASRLRHFLYRRKTPLRILLRRRTNLSELHTGSPFDKLRPRYQTTLQFSSVHNLPPPRQPRRISDATSRVPILRRAAEIVSPACTRHHIDADTFHTANVLPLHPNVFPSPPQTATRKRHTSRHRTQFHRH
jgi:hypothetical protein